MIGASLRENGLLHRSDATELTDLLPEDHQVTDACTCFASGIAVAALEGGATCSDCTRDDFVDGRIEARVLVTFDLTAQACRANARVSADLVGDVVTRAREILLIEESDLDRSARHALESFDHKFLGEFSRGEIRTEFVQFDLRLGRVQVVHVAETAWVVEGQEAWAKGCVAFED